MELRARIDFSGSVRFDVRGGGYRCRGRGGRPLRISGPLRLLDHGRLVIEDIRPDGKEKDG